MVAPESQWYQRRVDLPSIRAAPIDPRRIVALSRQSPWPGVWDSCPWAGAATRPQSGGWALVISSRCRGGLASTRPVSARPASTRVPDARRAQSSVGLCRVRASTKPIGPGAPRSDAPPGSSPGCRLRRSGWPIADRRDRAPPAGPASRGPCDVCVGVRRAPPWRRGSAPCPGEARGPASYVARGILSGLSRSPPVNGGRSCGAACPAIVASPARGRALVRDRSRFQTGNAASARVPTWPGSTARLENPGRFQFRGHALAV